MSADKPGQRTRTIPPLKRDENGTPICRHWDCDKPVGKGRRSWCSAESVHDALMQSNPSYQREQVLRRDQGICAECGCDTLQLRRQNTRLKGWTIYQPTRKRIAKRFGFDSVADLERAANWGAWKRTEDHNRRAQERHRRAGAGRLVRSFRRHEPERPPCDETTCLRVDRFLRILERHAKIRRRIFREDLTRR